MNTTNYINQNSAHLFKIIQKNIFSGFLKAGINNVKQHYFKVAVNQAKPQLELFRFLYQRKFRSKLFVP